VRLVAAEPSLTPSSFSFRIDGAVEFALYVGKASDRAGFAVYVDDKSVGAGLQIQPLPSVVTAPQRVYAQTKLDRGEHVVTVKKVPLSQDGDWLAFNCPWLPLPKRAHALQTSSSPNRATLPRAPLPVYTLRISSSLERSCSVLYQYLLHRARHGTTRSENGRRRDEISTYGQSARLTRRESMSLELRRTCGILSARPSDASPRPCSR